MGLYMRRLGITYVHVCRALDLVRLVLDFQQARGQE